MDLSEYVGCPAEKGIYPEGLLEEAKRPPPLYFETDDPTLQGTCCVCYKKGVLGRCPNSGCGLLMHYTCVQSEAPGAPQICPICKTENDSEEKIPKSMPFWHEAEIGTKSARRFKKPDSGPPTFPTEDGGGRSVRWPTAEEAQLHGYQTIEDWYLDFRSGGNTKTPEQLAKFKAEFVLVQSTWADREARKELSEGKDDEVSAVLGRPASDSVLAGLRVPCALGTAETGRSLAGPLLSGAEEPLTWQRVERVFTLREALKETLDAK